MALSTSDKIAFYSLIIAIIALLVSVSAAAYSVWRSDKTASAGMLISLHDGLRGAWESYLASVDDARRRYAFAELANLLEISCALYLNKSLTGLPRSLMESYLVAVLGYLASNEAARIELASLLESSNTFEQIKRFEQLHRNPESCVDPTLIPS